VKPIVIKFGGELIEDPARLRTVVAAIASVAKRRTPLAVVHGGGKEIDAALKGAAIEKHQIEGLRITDQPTLDVVVGVLAGTVNTRLVGALNTAGVAAVGLTGADARCGLSDRARPHTSVDGRSVDLGLVGIPNERSDARLLKTLIDGGYVPVIASIGIGEDGQLYNVNADTFAGSLAARLGATRLIVAGTTAGVLGDNGATIPTIESSGIEPIVSSGTATAGMIAKLRACEHALTHGVDDVVILDGQESGAIEAAADGQIPVKATRLAAMAMESRSGA
jgi:acetylglutamate kinase